MPSPEQLLGLRLYCLTVKCRVVFDDLEVAAGVVHEHHAVIPAAVALGLLACTALALALFVPCLARHWRVRMTAVVVGVLLRDPSLLDNQAVRTVEIAPHKMLTCVKFVESASSTVLNFNFTATPRI